MLRTTRNQRGIAEEVNVGADVFDQIVVSDDLLGEPVKLTSCVHSRGTHVVEGLNSRDKSKTVRQGTRLVDGKGQAWSAGVERGLLGSNRLFDLVTPHPKLDVTI